MCFIENFEGPAWGIVDNKHDTNIHAVIETDDQQKLDLLVFKNSNLHRDSCICKLGKSIFWTNLEHI